MRVASTGQITSSNSGQSTSKSAGIGGAVALFRLGAAGEVDRAFRPHIDAGGIDQQRHVGIFLARLEDEDVALARLDRQRKPGQRGDLAGIRPGGVDDDAGLERLAIVEA